MFPWKNGDRDRDLEKRFAPSYAKEKKYKSARKHQQQQHSRKYGKVDTKGSKRVVYLRRAGTDWSTQLSQDSLAKSAIIIEPKRRISITKTKSRKSQKIPMSSSTFKSVSGKTVEKKSRKRKKSVSKTSRWAGKGGYSKNEKNEGKSRAGSFAPFVSAGPPATTSMIINKVASEKFRKSVARNGTKEVANILEKLKSSRPGVAGSLAVIGLNEKKKENEPRKRKHEEKENKPEQESKSLHNSLQKIPSMSFHEKMRNWTLLNEKSSLDAKLQDRLKILGPSSQRGKGQKRQEAKKAQKNETIKEKDTKRTLHTTFERSPAPPNTAEKVPTVKDAIPSPKPHYVIPDNWDGKEFKYTRLLDGLPNVKGDFENAKRNMGMTKRPQTKEEMKEQQWDHTVRQFLEAQAGMKPSNVGLQKNMTNNKNQNVIISELKKSVRELSLTEPLNIINPPTVYLEEYTVGELKNMLESECSGPLPKSTVAQLRKVLMSLGFHGEIVNYNKLVRRLDEVAYRKFGYRLSDMQLKGFLEREVQNIVAEQREEEIKRSASKANVNLHVEIAQKSVMAFLAKKTYFARRDEDEMDTRKPYLQYQSTLTNGQRKQTFRSKSLPLKIFKERQRIREAEKFWKLRGKSSYNWNDFKAALEIKHRRNYSQPPHGISRRQDGKYRTTLETYDRFSKLSEPDLVAAMKQIIHDPVPLTTDMENYQKKVEGFRIKFPRLFRYEKDSTPPQFKNEYETTLLRTSVRQ